MSNNLSFPSWLYGDEDMNGEKREEWEERIRGAQLEEEWRAGGHGVQQRIREGMNRKKKREVCARIRNGRINVKGEEGSAGGGEGE